MMARLSLATLLSTLLFIQTSLALPFGGWFKHHNGGWSNGTAPAFFTAFPTAFPTATGGALPTGYFEKRHGHARPSGVFPSGGFPFPTGAFPTGVFPTGGFPTAYPTAYPTGFSAYNLDSEVEAQAEVMEKRFEGPRKADRYSHHWGYGGFPHHPAGPVASEGFPTGGAFPTGTGVAFPTGTAGPTAFPTAY